MKTGILFALAIGCVASSASALPLVPHSAIAPTPSVVNVRIVCEPDGHCYQQGRRPVARWVYGEAIFNGPYVGPGYYGNPGRHWPWWPFQGF